MLWGLLILSFLLLPIVGLSQRGQSQSPAASVFVHLFEWKWNDVAQECEQFLGPMGYSAVQVSPATEHVVLPQKGFPWWQRYQPVSYKLTSRSGSRAEFARMISRCHAAGVRVYADAVINHMAGVAGGVGSGGSPFSKYRYPGLYESTDFHRCRRNITNYQNHAEVTDCELVGLADLDTQADRVRQRIADYLIDLTHLGVDGFRIDAAKHIRADDLAVILNRVNKAAKSRPYIYQEVIDPGNEAVRKTEYYQNGRVIEVQYGRLVAEAFMQIDGRSLTELQTLQTAKELMPSQQAIVFIDNHDKQRGHGGGGNYLTYKDGRYDLANVFMLAYPYGTPQVMSSYAFADSDQGPPADAQGHTQSIYSNGRAACYGAWVCEHRHPAIAGMVGWRNAVALNAPLLNWWSNGSDRIAFGRGQEGFVVINRSTQPLQHTWQTGLPAGSYCNVIVGDCTAAAPVAVDDRGQMTATVPPMSAVAIHHKAKLS